MSSYSHGQGNAFRKFVAAPAEVEERSSALSQDVKLFATFWLGGVVFFGTFLA